MQYSSNLSIIDFDTAYSQIINMASENNLTILLSSIFASFAIGVAIGYQFDKWHSLESSKKELTENGEDSSEDEEDSETEEDEDIEKIKPHKMVFIQYFKFWERKFPRYC
jgi:hypothetical protein